MNFDNDNKEKIEQLESKIHWHKIAYRTLVHAISENVSKKMAQKIHLESLAKYDAVLELWNQDKLGSSTEFSHITSGHDSVSLVQDPNKLDKY